MVYNGNSLTMNQIKIAFHNAFCGGKDCENFPCAINRTSDFACNKTFATLIKDCPDYKIGTLEKIQHYVFKREGE